MVAWNDEFERLSKKRGKQHKGWIDFTRSFCFSVYLLILLFYFDEGKRKKTWVRKIVKFSERFSLIDLFEYAICCIDSIPFVFKRKSTAWYFGEVLELFQWTKDLFRWFERQILRWTFHGPNVEFLHDTRNANRSIQNFCLHFFFWIDERSKKLNLQRILVNFHKHRLFQRVHWWK